MTTPPQTRSALAEIPDRLEALRVGTAATTLAHHQLIPEDHLDNTTNVALAQEYIRSPVPSPDELVIRQRGRRRLTTWSPNRAANMSASTINIPFQRTPTKLLSSSMILRSSPRKRLTMGSTPPEPATLSCTSPSKFNAKQQLWPSSPHFAKKQRLGNDNGNDEVERPLAQLNVDIPLDQLLQGMSKVQLVKLIVGDLIGDDTKREERLRAQLPLPDVNAMQAELLHIKRNIFRSLPTSRLCKKTDSSAYSRAALHLCEFKRLLSTHSKQLHDAAHWDALLDYVTLAWPCVRATPHWDSVSHNAVRRQCFKLLSCNCIAAVKNGALRLGMMRLNALERNLCDWAKDYEDVLCCVNVLNKTLSKGRTSL